MAGSGGRPCHVIYLAHVRGQAKVAQARAAIGYASTLHDDGTVDLHVDARGMQPEQLERLGYDLLDLARAGRRIREGGQ